MPTSGPAPIPDPAGADELLRHAAWLHALARTLVGEADADDVVQETWVAAIAKPPRVLGSLRAWLGTVARNVVRKQARADSRRHERELAAERRDPEPATDQVVARAARMRELVERVLALDEPYRTTILLRFFEGVKPQEIARRVGASEEAVRQRLKRGLDRLRERLDAEHGGERERWIAGLAPLVAAPAVHVATVAATPIGMVVKGMLMTSPARIAIAGAVLVVAAGIAVLLPRSRIADSGANSAKAKPASSDSSPTATATSAASETPNAEARRDRVGGELDRATSPTAAAPTGPVRFVYGAVVDDAGVALDLVRISLWALSSADAAAPSATSPWSLASREGSWSTAGISSGRWHVEASHDGFATLARDFTIAPDVEQQRLDLVLKRALAIPVRFRTPSGEALADVMKEDEDRRILCNFAVSGLPSAPPAQFEVGFVASGQMFGAGRWFPRKDTPYNLTRESSVAVPADADGLMMVEGEAPAFLAVTLKHVTLASARVGDPAQRVDLVVDPGAIDACFVTLHVRIVDAETQRPIEGASFEPKDQAAWNHSRETTDADGRATCVRVLPGLLHIEVEAGGHEQVRYPRVVDAGAEVDLGTIELGRAQTLRGRVHRADGKRSGGWASYIDLDRWHHGLPADSDHSWSVDADGRFEFDDLGRGRYLVSAGDQDTATLPTIVDTRRDPLPELQIERVAGTEVRFEMEPPEPLQTPVFEIDDAKGDLVSSWRGISSHHLVPGQYRLSAWRGETRVLDQPFEVGASPSTVRIPSIADPAGLARERRLPSTSDPTAATIAPKIQGDPIGIVCYGRIEGGDDRGLRECGVTMFTNLHLLRASEARGGCFAVAGLGAGRTERRLYATKVRLPFSDWIDVASSPSIQRRDFHVEPGTQVTIWLVDAATGDAVDRIPDSVRKFFAIPRFAVIASKEPPPSTVPVIDPDWNYFAAYGAGRFQWEWPDNFAKPGTLDITEPLPVFVSLTTGGRVLHTELLAAPVRELRLPVDWNAIRDLLTGVRIKLVDAESGEPLAATVVEVMETSMGPPWSAGWPSLPFDVDGGYERNGIPPGLRKLCVCVEGHESICHELELPPGRVTDLGTLALAKKRVGTGRVVDEKGQPVRVTVFRVDAARARLPVPLIRNDYLETGADGTFRFDVGASPFELRVANDRFAATCIEIDPAHEPADDVKIVLSSGTPVSFHLTGCERSRERFVVADAVGRTVASTTLTMGAARFTLRPGHYVGTALDRGEEVARAEFDVADRPLDVELKP